ncbi:hypothetical protein FACS1894106_3420 [Spirochaetia bacterium]|nr:hypothetical protein FACS1894106_3420 [Spirochaetia bacterium]
MLDVKSSAFSPDKVNALNIKMANIQPYLFFAAYYTPKQPSEKSSYEYLFWCALTNIYALFKDCANYLNTWMYVLKRNNIISEEGLNSVKKNIDLICDLRSVFCHNSCKESKNNVNAFQSLTDILSIKSNLPYRLKPDECQWENALKMICVQSDKCLSFLSAIIDQNSTNQVFLDTWADSVAKWYTNSNYIWESARDYYQMKSIKSRKQDINNECINNWRNTFLSNDKEFKRVIRNMNGKALPFETADLLLNEADVNGKLIFY